MQSRAWAARVSGTRGARCAPLTAPVGVLVEIALHLQDHDGRCALYIKERAARARALGCHCSCFLSRFASLCHDAFHLWRGSAFVSAGSLAFCSRFCRRSSLVPALDSAPVCLISASGTPSLVAWPSTYSILSTCTCTFYADDANLEEKIRGAIFNNPALYRK